MGTFRRGFRALFAVLGYILYYDLLARRRGIETYSSIIPLVLLNLVFTAIVPVLVL